MEMLEPTYTRHIGDASPDSSGPGRSRRQCAARVNLLGRDAISRPLSGSTREHSSL